MKKLRPWPRGKYYCPNCKRKYHVAINKRCPFCEHPVKKG